MLPEILPVKRQLLQVNLPLTVTVVCFTVVVVEVATFSVIIGVASLRILFGVISSAAFTVVVEETVATKL